MSPHDETPTSELSAIADEMTRPLPPVRRHARRPWYRKRGRAAIVAVASAASLAMAGVAFADAGGESPAKTTTATTLSMSTGHAPTRNAAPRANRATRPTPPTTKLAAPNPAWVTPLATFYLTSCYGMRWGRLHQGIDFVAAFGTTVRAVHAGTVVAAGWNNGGYGNMVIIRHNSHLLTLYGHGSKVLVHVGQHVSTGQPIALEGATGHAFGAHVHFEVWTAMWQRINPGPFLLKQGIHLSRCQ